MDQTNNNIWIIAEAYAAGTLSAAEREALEKRLATEPDFAASFEEHLNLIRSLKQNAAQNVFKSHLKQIAAARSGKRISVKAIGSVQLWRTAAVAAGAALLTFAGTNAWQHKQAAAASGYSELRKVRTEIEGIKQSQNRIISDLNNKANKPAGENKYSGTGFALSNDGYIVTNYHVTEGADSVYIQTRDGNYYRAATVSFDAAADIAVLKVEHKKFKFNKSASGLPYTFATGKIGLSERIFTLGYPQDEIVYSEGYISSRNGYQGDSMQYRLELPAEPGQSGAPVLDASGNVVGIVTGKETKSITITYAVSSEAVLKLLRSIPQGNNIVLPKAGKLGKLNRAKQIEKLQDYTCVVAVFKK